MKVKNWLLALFVTLLFTTKVSAVERPNVIIVFTDDQGYGDLSCHGNPILKTPNLDKLHDESVSFTDFHVASVCTPSRGELMSGQYALRNKACMVPSGRNLMRTDIVTMPEVFADNGYKTGLFGKWHLGDTYPHRPMDRGFQRVVWHKGWGLASEIEYDNSYYKTRYLDEMEVKYSDKFCANLWFDKAMEWMDEQIDSKQPFFTYLALNTPHSPYDPLPEDLALYKGKVEKGVARFYALIHNIDQNYARLDSWLKKRGIRDNTIVVYMNDNGTSMGHHVFNASMRGKKGSEYEGGHRAICFTRWPNRIDKSMEVGGVSHITDLLPTFVDLLDFKTPASASFDGISLKDYLLGKKSFIKDRKLIVQYGGRIKPQKHVQSCVIWNKYRLVNGIELYDRMADPSQENDIASQFPQVVKKMDAHYLKYWNKVAPEIEKVEPLLVGHDKEPYTDLTCNNWVEIDCDNRVTVAKVKSKQASGDWEIDVVEDGTYSVKLSRWPFHLNRKLTLKGPLKDINGRKLVQGIALPIAQGKLLIDNSNELSGKPSEQGTYIEIEVDLKAGLHTLEGWFEDANGSKLSGVFYGRVEKL